MVKETASWLVVIHGEADQKEVRVVLEFQDTEALFSPSSYSVGSSFISRFLNLVRLHDHWTVKTVVEEVRTPNNIILAKTTPLFVLLARTYPRELSAGALFISSDVSSVSTPSTSSPRPESITSALEAMGRYTLAGISPIGFAATCADDSRVFTSFIARLLKRPNTFTQVTMLLTRDFAQ